MHGQNRVRKPEAHPLGHVQVAEIFPTIQGEGPYAGRVAVFIRLTGCNLRCWFCDTKWDDDKDPVRPSHEVAKEAALLAPKTTLVVITGGEPLRQDLHGLIINLALVGFETIQIETAGTLWQPIMLHHKVKIVVSPKTPKIHPEIYRSADAFKYVIRREYEPQYFGHFPPVFNTQRAEESNKIEYLAHPRPGAPVYLSPLDEEDEVKNTNNMNEVVRMALDTGHIVGLQLHKILGLR